jgi:hypothetical protein
LISLYFFHWWTSDGQDFSPTNILQDRKSERKVQKKWIKKIGPLARLIHSHRPAFFSLWEIGPCSVGVGFLFESLGSAAQSLPGPVSQTTTHALAAKLICTGIQHGTLQREGVKIPGSIFRQPPLARPSLQAALRIQRCPTTARQLTPLPTSDPHNARQTTLKLAILCLLNTNQQLEHQRQHI